LKLLNEHKLLVREPLTVAHVDLSAIRHNFLSLQRLAHKHMVAGPQKHMELISVVKADAYGHGMLEVARTIDECGGKFFGVSNVHEGALLREAGFKQEVLVFETTLPELAQPIVDNDLTPTICTIELASALHRYAKSLRKKINVHVKIDTAMGRLGIPLEGSLDFIDNLRSLSHLNLQGIYTHFPSADTNESLTLRQIRSFMNLIAELEKRGQEFKYVHAANSIGFVGYKNVFFNLARPGLMLYGLYPTESSRSKIHLKPALSVSSKIIFLKNISKGQGVSYGQSFVAPADMTVAVLPIGYNDGYSRALSNKACVVIDGERCPVVGRVTMDQIVVDVTRVKAPRLGMPVVLLGEGKNASVTADELAEWSQTINYEVVCNLGNRLARVYKGERAV
jgi:alanine racemase